jgi:hypothetical protein
VSAAKKSNEKSWDISGSWAGAWKISAVAGVAGLAAAGFGYTQDPRRFAFSWMFAFVTVLAIALGAIFFVLVQRLTSAGWSVTVRRTAEFFANGIVVLIPLFLPILFSMGHLFPWLGAGHEAKEPEAHSSIALVTPAYAQEPAAPATDHGPRHGLRMHAGGLAGGHAEPPAGEAAHGGMGHGAEHRVGPGMPDPHALIHSELMESKTWWLTKNFFLVRVCIYFLVWTILAMRLFGWSTEQDKSKDPKLTVTAQKFSPPMTFLFAFTLTGAAFDWIMSLEPTWFSTIFGVYYFATAVVSSLAVIILVTMALKNSGPLDGAVTVEHYHDLGKLLFGFLVFWAYIGFSQFMLIWYAALPEETTWYHNRWDYAPWESVSKLILLGHFVVPFFWLISRTFKRNLGRLQIGASILLVMHVVDMYWFVMPNFLLGKEGFTFHWLDAACLLAVGGLYCAFVFYRMTQFSLVPVGDPRLERSLHFQNA